MNKEDSTNETKNPTKDATKRPTVFADSLRDPILGKHFKLPGLGIGCEKKVQLDTSLSYIPVYTHVKIDNAEMLKRPTTPPAIRRIQNEEYMEFYTKSATAAANGTQLQATKPTTLKDEDITDNSKFNKKF